MKILVTGANGFIGKNLVTNLECIKNKTNKTRNIIIDDIFVYDVNNSEEELIEYCKNCDFIYNLAGINRPLDNKEFDINHSFLANLINILETNNRFVPIMLSSSIQAELDNVYGNSKRKAEQLLFDYNNRHNTKCYVYRFPNVFGKWCRPNYNSVVATFCNNIANDIDISINDPNKELELVYIDDVVNELLDILENKEHHNGEYCYVPTTYKKTVGEIAELIYMFAKQPSTLLLPNIENNSFEKELYSTYLSYLPKDKICFDLDMKVDDRGSFTEFLKTNSNGQISINVTKPGITRGQHFHNSKWEFFLVVSGKGLIQERKIGSDEVIEFEVSADKLQAVHMLPGYTHNIINLSDDTDLVTIMWANELFDENNPDTYHEEV